MQQSKSRLPLFSQASADDSRPIRILRRVLVMLHHLFALAPLLILVNLYLFSWRATTLIGHWPQPFRDDPQFIVYDDILSEQLYLLVNPLFFWALVGFVALPVLTIFLRRVYPRWWTIGIICLFLIGWVLLFAEPTDRIVWYMD